MKKMVTRRFDENLSGYSELSACSKISKTKTKQLSKFLKKSCEIIVRKKIVFFRHIAKLFRPTSPTRKKEDPCERSVT